MSFILDALKKAEQKRREGTVPDLQTTHLPEPPPVRKKAVWVYLLTAVLLANGALLAWLVFNPSSRSVEKGAKRPAAMSHHPNGASSLSTEPSPAPQASPPERGVAEAEPPAVAASPKTRAGGEAGASSATGPGPGAKGDAESAAPTGAAGGKTATPVPVQTPANVAGPAAQATAAEAAPPVSSEPRVYALNELPPELRQKVPAMTLTLHFYTARVAARMVRLNGMNLHQGDEVARGVTVDEITPTGVIFKMEGYRFEVPGLTVRAGGYRPG